MVSISTESSSKPVICSVLSCWRNTWVSIQDWDRQNAANFPYWLTSDTF